MSIAAPKIPEPRFCPACGAGHPGHLLTCHGCQRPCCLACSTKLDPPVCVGCQADADRRTNSSNN